jgi:hypothetical protein
MQTRPLFFLIFIIFKCDHFDASIELTDPIIKKKKDIHKGNEDKDYQGKAN